VLGFLGGRRGGKSDRQLIREVTAAFLTALRSGDGLAAARCLSRELRATLVAPAAGGSAAEAWTADLPDPAEEQVVAALQRLVTARHLQPLGWKRVWIETMGSEAHLFPRTTIRTSRTRTSFQDAAGAKRVLRLYLRKDDEEWKVTALSEGGWFTSRWMIGKDHAPQD
jgi:hypothetical protein